MLMAAELLQHYLILEHLFACILTLNYLHKTLERQSAPSARNGFSPKYIKLANRKIKLSERANLAGRSIFKFTSSHMNYGWVVQ